LGPSQLHRTSTALRPKRSNQTVKPEADQKAMGNLFLPDPTPQSPSSPVQISSLIPATSKSGSGLPFLDHITSDMANNPQMSA